MCDWEAVQVQVILTSRTWDKARFSFSFYILHVLEWAITSEEDKLLQKMLAGDRGRTLSLPRNSWPCSVIPALALGLSCLSLLLQIIVGKQTWSQQAKPLWRAAAQLTPGRARFQQLLSEGREAARPSQRCWLRRHSAGDICLPSRELNPAGRGRCQHPAWESMRGSMQEELAVGGGEKTLSVPAAR